MSDLYAFTLEEFRAWLESKKWFDSVGTANLSCECPLHTFLKEARGLDVAVRGTGLYARLDDEKLSREPVAKVDAWVDPFIELVDNSLPRFRQVMAEEALALLRVVEQRMKEENDGEAEK